MEYVARLFIEGGGFQGIANAHNAALEPAKAETEAHLIVMPPVESTATFGSILGHVRHSKLKRLKTRTILQS
jgi:hypothetical protein